MNLFESSKRNKFLRLKSIQYLRIFSAISVILFHVESGINEKYGVYDNYIQFFGWGKNGVSIFFCLSGFIIPYSNYFRPKKIFSFLYLRLIRIYPTYLFTLSVIIPALIFLPNKSINPNILFDTIFFNFGSAGGYIYVGWTLYYEIIFYLIFSLIVKNFREIAQNDIFIYLISLLLIYSYFSSLYHITDFLIGINVFLIKLSLLKKYKSINFIILIFSLIFGVFFKPISFCIGIILIISTNFEEIFKNLFNSKYILALADSTYSIYLVQVITISASLKISRIINLNTFDNYYFMYVISFLISTISTITLGILLKKYVENPFYKTLKKII